MKRVETSTRWKSDRSSRRHEAVTGDREVYVTSTIGSLAFVGSISSSPFAEGTWDYQVSDNTTMISQFPASSGGFCSVAAATVVFCAIISTPVSAVLTDAELTSTAVVEPEEIRGMDTMWCSVRLRTLIIIIIIRMNYNVQSVIRVTNESEARCQCLKQIKKRFLA